MRSGSLAVFVVFALNGIVVGSWAPRMPALAEQIDTNEGQLGLALLGASVGLIAVASVAGQLAARFGARALVLVSAMATVLVLPLMALVDSVVQLGLVLVLLGVMVGALDVAMNVAAVEVVRRVDRPLMAVFHAGFSVGALVGSLGAAGAAAAGIGLLGHFVSISVLTAAATLAVVAFVPRRGSAARSDQPAPPDRGRLLRRPVLWLLGAVALCSAIVEGASGDWSALFAVRERGLSEAAAAVTFSVFCVAMAVVRLAGERAQRRFGDDRLLVGGALVAGAGLLLTATVPTAALVYVGFALAGGGLAFVFPIALNLAGAAGRRADGTGGEREIGFVTTIAYSGFLLGPPLVGGIAHVTNLQVALGVAGAIAALIAPVTLAAAAARRREGAEPAGREPALGTR